MPITKATKRVSWAYPLIKSTPLAAQHTPEQEEQNSTVASDYSAQPTRENKPSAAHSLRDILQGTSSSPPSSSLQEVLSHDAFYSDPSPNNCWSAYCKFTDVLANKDTELSFNYFFSKSDVLVSLFIHCDLTKYGGKKMLAEDLLMELVDHFPLCTRFKFAVFFPREQVEGKANVPKALKYLFGTFDALSCFDISLDGAITDMEKKFVALHWFHTRRLRLDTVQIHKDGLEKGILLPKVDADDLNSEPLKADHLLQPAPKPTATQPIDIIWPKQKDVSDAWIRPAKNQAVWA
ncbi:hypothetical protein E4T39_01481 [Aureobasidium subglaciale]|nr:hypothetical protein E4T39_01481 [Aureobasidium subglaciale]